MMWSKSKGSGIMVSDFIDKRNGYLRLTDKDYSRVKEKDSTIHKHAHQLLECGESKEG